MVGVLATPAAASVNGEFTQLFRRSNQPHRVYFEVTAGRGSKSCAVTLRRKTQTVSLGSDKVAELSYLYYTHTRIAEKALAQGKAGNGSIICSH